MGESTEELSMDIARTRAQLSQNVDELGDKVSPSQAMNRQKQAVKSRLTRMKDQVMGSTHDTGSTVGHSFSEAGSSVGDSASAAVEGIQRRTEGNPLAAGVVAFGVGMLLSAAFPSTRPEQALAQQGMDAAKEHGQPVMDEMKSAASDVGADLKESAQEAMTEVRATARSSAETVKQEGQGAAQHVKETGTQA